MNYKQAYMLLRSYGHTAEEVRKVLEQAEFQLVLLGDLIVTYSEKQGGFFIKEEK